MPEEKTPKGKKVGGKSEDAEINKMKRDWVEGRRVRRMNRENDKRSRTAVLCRPSEEPSSSPTIQADDERSGTSSMSTSSAFNDHNIGEEGVVVEVEDCASWTKQRRQACGPSIVRKSTKWEGLDGMKSHSRPQRKWET